MDAKKLTDDERRERLTARAHDLGTTLDYRDEKKYPDFERQIAMFSELIGGMSASRRDDPKRPELTGPEIEGMKSKMEHGGAPAASEAAAIHASVATMEDTCPDCGGAAVHRFTVDEEFPGDAAAEFLRCTAGHEWQAPE